MYILVNICIFVKYVFQIQSDKWTASNNTLWYWLLPMCCFFFKAANSVSNKDEIRSKIGLTFIMDVPLVELTILVHHFILEKKCPAFFSYNFECAYNISFQWRRPFRKYTQNTISWRRILMIWHFGISIKITVIKSMWIYAFTISDSIRLILCYKQIGQWCANDFSSFFRLFDRNEISAKD